MWQRKPIQILLILSVMMLWASCYPLISLGLPHAPHLTFAALRASLAGGSLLILSFILQKPQPTGWRHWTKITIIGFCATTLGFFGMFHASEFISPGIATVLTNTQPLIAAVLASYFLKENLGYGEKAGLVVGFLGVILIAVPTASTIAHETYNLGLSYITIAAIGVAISNVILRNLSKQTNALTTMGWQLIIGSLFLWILALLFEDTFQINWHPDFIISLLGLAIPGTAMVYWLWCKILQHVELTYANSYSFLVPILGLLFGYFFFQENLSVQPIIGVILTLLGIVLVNINEKKSQKVEPTKIKGNL